jgi:cell division inhibitor SulA
MRALIAVLASFFFLTGPRAEDATERYAPAQLRVAQSLLEHAQAAAAMGESRRAGELARQASFDAWLARDMTESEQLRAEAAEVRSAARALIMRPAPRR